MRLSVYDLTLLILSRISSAILGRYYILCRSHQLVRRGGQGGIFVGHLVDGGIMYVIDVKPISVKMPPS
jgi:hypothetical protein